MPRVAVVSEVFHHALDEFFGLGQFSRDELNVHGGPFGVAGTVAVNAVLADEDEGVGHEVKRDGQAAAVWAHHGFEVIEFLAVLIEDGHRSPQMVIAIPR